MLNSLHLGLRIWLCIGSRLLLESQASRHIRSMLVTTLSMTTSTLSMPMLLRRWPGIVVSKHASLRCMDRLFGGPMQLQSLMVLWLPLLQLEVRWAMHRVHQLCASCVLGMLLRSCSRQMLRWLPACNVYLMLPLLRATGRLMV